jgi:dihydrofolate reductase
MMIVSAIAAMSRNRVIGKENQLPWKIPEDLKRFKAITLGHPIIMGRKTWESFGRPLPGRHNIVLTRNPAYRAEGVTTVPSIQQALSICASPSKGGEAFIVGGEEIYRLAMPFTRRIYLTLVHADYEGDANFPEWPPEFVEASREDHLDQAIPFSYVLLERK